MKILSGVHHGTLSYGLEGDAVASYCDPYDILGLQ